MEIKCTNSNPQRASWSVESESSPGVKYRVTYWQRGIDDELWRCDCPSRKHPCKHIVAVQDNYECGCEMDDAYASGDWEQMEAAEHDEWNGTKNTGKWQRVPEVKNRVQTIQNKINDSVQKHRATEAMVLEANAMNRLFDDRKTSSVAELDALREAGTVHRPGALPPDSKFVQYNGKHQHDPYTCEQRSDGGVVCVFKHGARSEVMYKIPTRMTYVGIRYGGNCGGTCVDPANNIWRLNDYNSNDCKFVIAAPRNQNDLDNHIAVYSVPISPNIYSLPLEFATYDELVASSHPIVKFALRAMAVVK